MKALFKPGDQKYYKHIVTSADFAAFHGEVVHPVCATFVLARDIEWTTRQFVLEMCEDDEEGIGTFLNVQHVSPAREGEEIIFKGTVEELKGNELICMVEASVHGRIVATGRTGQKILKREKLKKLYKDHE